MVAKIRKAVFPVAGFGTRFLPVTKTIPKEMLPIVDKPLIQYAVEEAISCGITELIFVTSSNKRAIEDYFDSNFELETKLERAAKNDLLATVLNILPKNVYCVCVRQQQQLGLGHAVLCAKDIVGNEPFMVILPDDLIDTENEKSCLAQMLEFYERDGHSVLALQRVAREETEKYGIVSVVDPQVKLGEITVATDIIEKPKMAEAASTLASMGRYILTPRLFEHLQHVGFGAIGEIQITDGIKKLMKDEPVHGYVFKGTRYDCGSKLGFLQAEVAYARKHPEISEEFNKYLQEII